MIGPVVAGPVVVPTTTTRLAGDVLLDLCQAAVVDLVVLVALVVAVAWYRWQCRGIYDAVVRASVDDALIEEVLDEVPVSLHLCGLEAIIHDVVADVLHPRCEVGANITARRIPCVEVMVAAEPWKPMISATASVPTSFIHRTGLLTASQLQREIAPKVPLNVVYPALRVVASEHPGATCQVIEFAR